ncbi:MAG: ParB/RepB/Spo0J family partition protein [Fimbriimonadaceae bacterium]|nr:ParB/RepB/Spo0J family partition protein [Fimbriimonadaceae bacterium]QYK54853.1 MAG: ParB/RepB/Spo0J family partition protein [Fimbriimonadaceae bacterium]
MGGFFVRRALGKGLSQWLEEEPRQKAKPASPKKKPATEQVNSANEVSVDLIKPNPRQPRHHFDEAALLELASSIKEHGVVQPLIVRPMPEGKFELIAGERRLRAARLAGLTRVPVVTRTADAKQSLEIALIENVQREDVNAMECARAYYQLVNEFGLTQEQVGQRIGKTRAAVANTLRLFKLPPEIQQAIEAGTVSEGHARALLMVESPLRQAALFRRIVAEGLSVRQAERLARGEAEPPTEPRAPKPRSGSSAEWVALEGGLREYFGAPVNLESKEVGGRLVVEFYSDDDLARILDILGLSLP